MESSTRERSSKARWKLTRSASSTAIRRAAKVGQTLVCPSSEFMNSSDGQTKVCPTQIRGDGAQNVHRRQDAFDSGPLGHDHTMNAAVVHHPAYALQRFVGRDSDGRPGHDLADGAWRPCADAGRLADDVCF